MSCPVILGAVLSGSYRFGFNGMERQDEIKSLPYNFENRLYDSRRGQFPTQDRLADKFPNQSPYVFAANTPIQAIDVDGDAAWVVIKTTSTLSGKTTQRMVFDKDLVNSAGVYFVHRWVNPNYNFVESQSSGVANYSEYSQKFPNFSNGVFDHKFEFSQLTAPFGLSLDIRILYGEAAYERSKGLGFSFGGEGNLIGYNFELKNNDINSNMTGYFYEDNPELNIGGNINFYGVGGGYRRKYDLLKGTFKEEDRLSVTGPINLDINTFNKNSVFSVSEGGKFSLGVGVSYSGDINFNINKFLAIFKPFSSYEESILKNAGRGTKSFNPEDYK